LDQVNYDTTLGDDMIVFYKQGTGKYNKRVHGGDIQLKSWFGFQRNIVVRCTGLVMEGVYPEMGCGVGRMTEKMDKNEMIC
jgi:hypothetical protein